MLDKHIESLLGVTDLNITLPTSRQECAERFSLMKDDTCVDNIQFEAPCFDHLLGLTVLLPRTKEEYDQRFAP